MGFFSWLKSLFVAKPLKRDVSWLEVDADAVDGVEEVVDLAGGPLKEGHRRLALRDRRLLPKPKPKADLYGRRKRQAVMSASEAVRLFGATLRTRNRNIRDLLTDEEQLARYGLPLWRSEEELAAALDLSVGKLRHYSIHREREQVCHYVTFSIPKRRGGRRLIMAPKSRLKAVQRKLNELLVSRLPVSEHAHGFRRGRSVRTNAEAHVGKAVVLNMDIKDFFPTVHFGRVRGLLIALGYSFPVAATLAALMTESPRQPVVIDDKTYHVPIGPRHCIQGAPTSPGLCNALVHRMDRRLAGLARGFGFVYSRYADDLTFSGDDRDAVHALRCNVARIVRAEGFAVNREKTRVARQGRRQTVTGVVVNRELGLSRKVRRRIRAAIHRTNQSNEPKARRRILGKLAYLSMLNTGQADTLRARLNPTAPG